MPGLGRGPSDLYRSWCHNFRGGTAIFTQPDTPIKCGGAPQKICYLADDYFRKSGVRDRSQVIFASASGGIFSVSKYAQALDRVIQRKGIDARCQHNLVALRPDRREAVFKRLDNGEEVVLQYDMIHVTPPQSAPDFIKQSKLAGEAGWVEVDQYTTQHVRYPNVFALGDCSSLPTSKTGAAIRKQAPVLVDNLMAALRGGAPARPLRRLHLLPPGHRLWAPDPGRVRLRGQAQGVLPLWPGPGALHHVRAEGLWPAPDVLARHAPRTGLSPGTGGGVPLNAAGTRTPADPLGPPGARSAHRCGPCR